MEKEALELRNEAVSDAGGRRVDGRTAKSRERGAESKRVRAAGGAQAEDPTLLQEESRGGGVCNAAKARWGTMGKCEGAEGASGKLFVRKEPMRSHPSRISRGQSLPRPSIPAIKGDTRELGAPLSRIKQCSV